MNQIEKVLTRKLKEGEPFSSEQERLRRIEGILGECESYLYGFWSLEPTRKRATSVPVFGWEGKTHEEQAHLRANLLESILKHPNDPRNLWYYNNDLLPFEGTKSKHCIDLISLRKIFDAKLQSSRDSRTPMGYTEGWDHLLEDHIQMIWARQSHWPVHWISTREDVQPKKKIRPILLYISKGWGEKRAAIRQSFLSLLGGNEWVQIRTSLNSTEEMEQLDGVCCPMGEKIPSSVPLFRNPLTHKEEK